MGRADNRHSLAIVSSPQHAWQPQRLLYTLGLLRPLVFYNRLALGQKDRNLRSTVTYLCSASTAPTDKAARRPTVLDCTAAHDQHLYDGFTMIDGRRSMRELLRASESSWLTQ